MTSVGIQTKFTFGHLAQLPVSSPGGGLQRSIGRHNVTEKNRMQHGISGSKNRSVHLNFDVRFLVDVGLARSLVNSLVN